MVTILKTVLQQKLVWLNSTISKIILATTKSDIQCIRGVGCNCKPKIRHHHQMLINNKVVTVNIQVGGHQTLNKMTINSLNRIQQKWNN